jgi:hypothetical protein
MYDYVRLVKVVVYYRGFTGNQVSVYRHQYGKKNPDQKDATYSTEGRKIVGLNAMFTVATTDQAMTMD